MSKYITKWNPKAVKAAVSGQVVQNMDAACQFAADRARALAPVKSGELRRNIDYEIDARGDVIEGRVGVRKGIFWAWFIEMGTRRTRARPFLRPAVFGNGDAILRIIRGEGVAVSAGKSAAQGSHGSFLGALKRGVAVARAVAGRFGVALPSAPSLPTAPSMPKLPSAPSLPSLPSAPSLSDLRKRRW